MNRRAHGIVEPSMVVALALVAPRSAWAFEDPPPLWECLPHQEEPTQACLEDRVAKGISADLNHCQLPPLSINLSGEMTAWLAEPGNAVLPWLSAALADADAVAAAFGDDVLPGSGVEVEARHSTSGWVWPYAKVAAAIATDTTEPPFDEHPAIDAVIGAGALGVMVYIAPPDACYADRARIVLDAGADLVHSLPTELAPEGEYSFQSVLLHELLHAWGLDHPLTLEPPAPTSMDPQPHAGGDPGDPVLWDATMRITGPEHLYLRQRPR